MSTRVRDLHRTSPLTAQIAVGPEPLDYCQCTRGPVIGVVSYTNDRMWFFPISSRNGDHVEGSSDLRCLDCVADVADRLASGGIADEYRAASQARENELRASQRRSQISVADQPRQTPPVEGDQVT